MNVFNKEKSIGEFNTCGFGVCDVFVPERFGFVLNVHVLYTCTCVREISKGAGFTRSVFLLLFLASFKLTGTGSNRNHERKS